MSSNDGLTGAAYLRLREWLMLQPDGKICGICIEEGKTTEQATIDMSLPSRHPQSWTLDHVIPRSKGGSILDPGNARAAHYSCNSRRGRMMRELDRISEWKVLMYEDEYMNAL